MYKENVLQHNPHKEEYDGESAGPFIYTKYAQCDFLLVKKEQVHTILDCEVKMEAAIDSDHYPIYGKLQTNMETGKNINKEDNKEKNTGK